MTCRDCIHNGVCGGFTPTDLDRDVFDYCREGRTDEIPDIEERCFDFKPKSRYIELPCAVGDTVYFPWEYDGQSGIAHNEVESIKIYCNNFPIIVVEDWESDMPMPISFSVQDFGETVFLTKEEAEKALAERSEGK